MDITGRMSWGGGSIPFYLGTTKKLETTQKANEKQQSEKDTLTEKKPGSTNLNSIDHLVERIKRGPQDRAKFVASHVDKGIAYQIRALRDRQELSQEQLAAKVGMNQNAISRLESPERGRPTITTLKRLAETFDVALIVRFVPFSKLVKWVSGTPFIEEGLSTESLAVPDFDEELKSGAFKFNVGTTITPEVTPQTASTALANVWTKEIASKEPNYFYPILKRETGTVPPKLAMVMKFLDTPNMTNIREVVNA